MRDFIDGTSNTILVVEADSSRAVTWTKPDDWEWNPQQPRGGLATGPGGFETLFADGSVQSIPNQASDELLMRLFIRNDGKPLPRDASRHIDFQKSFTFEK